MSAADSNDNGTLSEGLPLDDFLPYLLNRLTNRLNQDLVEDLRKLDVTVPMWRVLAVLASRDGRGIGELAVYTVTDQSTLSRVIDRMERDDLVERRPSPQDGRAIEVFVRPAGRQVFAKILPVALNHYRHAISGLSESESRTLLRLLHKVLDTVRRSPYA
jgi:MarR family transcriptional regulator, organic hydroperoxide resistance regulator